MNLKMIGRFLSLILFLETIFMIPAMMLCVYDGDTKAAMAFLITEGIAMIIAAILLYASKNAQKGFYAREGFICVGTGWILLSLIGCLPFFISRQIPSFIDALFETVSGFTTTGASILTDIEAISRGLLYWRSFSHWLGGMGVLVFILAITGNSKSDNSGFTLHILRAESPGPNVSKLVPKMKKTAFILYILYIFLTILDILFLLIGRIPLFDAICTALGTAGTGGFGIKGDSIAGYSPYIQNVCTIFILLFGVHFSCYYLLLIKHFKDFFKDEELKFYIITVISCTGLIAYNIRGIYPTLEEIIRHSAFQVASVITTTGYATAELAGTHLYLTAYVTIIIVSFLIVSLDNFTTMTNFSAVVSCFNNIGPGLEQMGPACNYAD